MLKKHGFIIVSYQTEMAIENHKYLENKCQKTLGKSEDNETDKPCFTTDRTNFSSELNDFRFLKR